MKVKASKKKFNPYIIPVMVILCVIPLIVHLKEYDTHLENYDYFGSSTFADFYLYHKAMCFIIVNVIMVGLIGAQCFIKHYKLEFKKLFIPLAGYAGLSFLSAVFSKTPGFSFTGIYEHFESVWVLLGYAITVYYCCIFISTEKEVDMIMTAFIISTVIMLLIGLSQAFSKDIYRTDFGRYLILPMEYWHNEEVQLDFTFPLGKVYLTLYNPNYVGSYVSLISPVFLMYAFAKKKIWMIVLNICIYVGLLLCILGSGSRAGFIGIAFSLLLLAVVFNKKIIKFLPEVIIILVLIGGTVYTYNNYTNDQLFSRVRQAMEIEEVNYNLTSIETNDNDVVFHYKGHELKITFLKHYSSETGTFALGFTDENGSEVKYNLADPDIKTDYRIFTTEDERFTGIRVGYGYKKNSEGKDLFGDRSPSILTVTVDGHDWDFVDVNFTNRMKEYTKSEWAKIWLVNWSVLDSPDLKEDEWSMYYINNWYTPTKMRTEPAEYVEGLDKYGRAFSGRGFIWSRTIPLLKNTIFLGTGPDTFLLNFPNDDYVAMTNAGHTTDHMTKPHNMYLQIAVQTGVLSLICFLIFYIWYFIVSIKLYMKYKENSSLKMVGIGILCGTFGYMIVGIINDSMVCIAPLFWAMIGIALAINRILSKELKQAQNLTVSAEKSGKKEKVKVLPEGKTGTEVKTDVVNEEKQAEDKQVEDKQAVDKQVVDKQVVEKQATEKQHKNKKKRR